VVRDVLRIGLKATIFGSAGALICMAIFFAVVAVSLMVPGELIRGRILQGYDTQSVVTADYPDEFRTVGKDNWTDCVTFQMAIKGEGSFFEELISPRRFWKLSPEEKNSPCAFLEEVVSHTRTASVRPEWRYHRYIHGSSILTRLFLIIFDVRTYRLILELSCYLLITGPILLRIRRIILNKNDPASTSHLDISLIVLSISFAVFYALDQYAMSISHGPASIIFLSALAVCLISDPSRWSHSQLLTRVAIFGSLTAIAEWLNGGIPLGVSLILGIFALYGIEYLRQGNKPRLQQTFTNALAAVIAYLVAIITCFVIKLGLATIIFGGSVLNDFADGLIWRLGESEWTLKHVYWALNNNLHNIAFGSVFLSRLSFISAIILGITGVIGILMAFGRRQSIPFFVLVLTSVLVVPIWYMLFRNHTAIHGWFMVRILAWPIAMGFAVFSYWTAMGWTDFKFFRIRFR